MDLRIAGLCIILAIIAENVEARHLSGGRLSPIFGQQDFQFSRPFGFRGGIPGLGQTGILPRRFQQFGQLGEASSPFRLPSIRPRFGSTRFPSVPRLGINDFGIPRRQIGGLRRLPVRLNPALRSTLRPFSPQITGPLGRIPLEYFRQRSRPGLIPRGRPISSDAIRQLRQRFRTRGTGTRNDPIRIIAPIAQTSGTLPGRALSQLRQRGHQPLQRMSRTQRRRVQVSRARQQLNQRPQEEVIALFGFDQPSGGSVELPVLSETIDKQTKIKRTPIKKSPITKSKITKTSADLKGTKGLNSVNISKPISDEFLQKLNVHQLERLAKGVEEATKIQPQHDVKHASQFTEKHTIKSQKLETSLSADNGHSLTTTDKSSQTNIENIGVPVAVDLGESTVDVGKSLVLNHEPVVFHEGKGQALTESGAKDPAGISVIADITPAETHSLTSTAETSLPSEAVGQIEKSLDTVVASELVVPEENVPLSDGFMPLESVSVTEVVAPSESVPVSDVVIPVESVSMTEVAAPGKGEAVSDVIVPVDSVAVIEEVAPIDSVTVSDIAVPVESLSVTEGAAVGEILPGSDVLTPIESVSLTEVVAQGEGEPVTGNVAQVEAFSAIDVISSTEDLPVSDIVVPIESVSLTEEVAAPLESVPVSDIIPVESVTDVTTPVESVPVSEVAIPVESVSKVVTTVESVPVSEVAIPVESVTEVATPVESVPVSEIAIPVESVKEVVTTVERVPVSEVAIPVESVTEVIAPSESVQVSEVALPVESVTEVVASGESLPESTVIVPVESVSVSETTIPAEILTVSNNIINSETLVSQDSSTSHALDISKHVKSASSSEVSIPVSSVTVEGKTSSDALIPSKLPVSDTIAIIDTSLPPKHTPIVGHPVDAGVLPAMTEKHVSVEKSSILTETSQMETKGKLIR